MPCRSTFHWRTLSSEGTAAMTSTWNCISVTRGPNWNFQLDTGLVADGAMIASYCQNGCPGAVRSIVPESSMTVTVPEPIETVGPLVTTTRVPVSVGVTPSCVPSGWASRLVMLVLKEKTGVGGLGGNALKFSEI